MESSIRPVPTPRRRGTKDTDQVDSAGVQGSYENVDLVKPKAEAYENVQLSEETNFVPKPAPRRKVSEQSSTEQPPERPKKAAEVKLEESVEKSTGAIRKAPPLPPPPQILNNLDETEKRERRNSSHSSHSGCSADSSSYKTASPK